MSEEQIVDELAPETTTEEALADAKNLPPDGVDHPDVPRAGVA